MAARLHPVPTVSGCSVHTGGVAEQAPIHPCTARWESGQLAHLFLQNTAQCRHCTRQWFPRRAPAFVDLKACSFAGEQGKPLDGKKRSPKSKFRVGFLTPVVQCDTTRLMGQHTSWQHTGNSGQPRRTAQLKSRA